MSSNKVSLSKNTTIYSKYYGDFRGVDFSSDHTQVADQRLAYAVNMYRDYKSGQGGALETIPGFRRRVRIPEEAEIYGIHSCTFKDGTSDTKCVLIHAGTKLYVWANYPYSVNVEQKKVVSVPEPVDGTDDVFVIDMGSEVTEVTGIRLLNVDPYPNMFSPATDFDASDHCLHLYQNDINTGDYLLVSYIEGQMNTGDAIFTQMNEHKSTSFFFNNKLYIIDGANYLVYDGSTVSSVIDNAYIPTTYINIIPSGENADIGTEHEQRNILQPKFKHTFIADGTTTDFYVNEELLEGFPEVKVYGVVKTYQTDYIYSLTSGYIRFNTAPPKPEDEGYPELYAGIEITAKKQIKRVSGVEDSDVDVSNIISSCTIATVFDSRVFLSGNPKYPNHIFFSERNGTGFVDPSYFGILNYVQDGIGDSPVTGMVPVADTLMVLKRDSQQDGTTYFHTPQATGNGIQPKIYPSSQGLPGIGCLGACINFLDDPVFVSRLGLEAIGQLSVRYERAVEHRSSMVDAKLVNLDLSKAVLEEWDGYLVLLVDGNIFLADNRQRFTHTGGTMQYEWYYLEGIGVWQNQYTEYRYANRAYDELKDATVNYCTLCKKGSLYCTCGNTDNQISLPLLLADSVYDDYSMTVIDQTGEVANAPNQDGNASLEVFDESVDSVVGGETVKVGVYYTVRKGTIPGSDGYAAYLCETKGNATGGVFHPACVIKSMEENLFFGTNNGYICSFNFDKREDVGSIPSKWYSFDGRTILCGCATKMDCCDIPHMTKNTIKKSTVIKTKTFQDSAAKIKVRTNKKPYSQIARINSTRFAFDNLDFSDFSFKTDDQSLFAVKEKEKKWVEKQYYVYSDEYCKPFALYYISYRYKIQGRYKG